MLIDRVGDLARSQCIRSQVLVGDDDFKVLAGGGSRLCLAVEERFSFGLRASVLATSSMAMVDPQSFNHSCLSSRGEVLLRSQCIRSQAIVGDDGSKVPFCSGHVPWDVSIDTPC